MWAHSGQMQASSREATRNHVFCVGRRVFLLECHVKQVLPNSGKVGRIRAELARHSNAVSSRQCEFDMHEPHRRHDGVRFLPQTRR